MRMTQVMIFVLLIGSFVVAEEAPNKVTSTAAYRADSTSLAALPATPKPQRVIDKKFVVLMGTLGRLEPQNRALALCRSSSFCCRRDPRIGPRAPPALPGLPAFPPTHI